MVFLVILGMFAAIQIYITIVHAVVSLFRGGEFWDGYGEGTKASWTFLGLYALGYTIADYAELLLK